MKIAFGSALALILAVLSPALSPALAQGAPPPEMRTLTMSGQGEAHAAPDMATFVAGVSAQAPTAGAALAANSARMRAVTAALRKIGVADNDMQTTDFSVSPQVSGGDGQPPHVTGYRVDNNLRVRLNDVDKLGATLDALVNAGANQVNMVSFAIRDPAPLLAQARQGAVADARAKAQAYAEAAGVTLGPILSIGEDDGARPAYAPMPMLRAAKAVPIAAGEQSVGAQVSIVWEIH